MNPNELSPHYIRAIAPYQPGKPIGELAREMGLDEADIVKLASNENPLGIGPLARAAIARAVDELALYPDGNGFDLKAALSRKLGIGTDRIVLGNGSNDVLDMVARAFLAPGTSSVYSRHAFAVYALATQAAGAIGIEAPARDFGHDLSAMQARVQRHTRVVWIANPNNPTGTLLDNGQLHAALQDFARTDAVVVLDEAYVEYMEPNRRAPSLAWLAEFSNLIVCRTFSKAYGLAGLRVGYAACAPELADLLNRVRQPFNVNSLALSAATAALDDLEFLAETKRINDSGMIQLTEGFDSLGLEWIPSAGNFVAVRVDPQGDAMAIFQALLRKGVIVRPVGNYAMPGYLRVSVGLPEQNARFLAALGEILGAR